MYNNNYVELKKERDLGAIISDTFKFLRLEWKPLFSILLKMVLIPVLINFVLAIYDASDTLTNTSANPLSNFSLISLLIYIIAIGNFYLMSLIINIYIREYIHTKGNVDRTLVVNDVKKHFLSFAGMGVLTTLIIFVGLIFCFVPGLYLMVPLSVVGSVYVFQSEEALTSISNAFTTIKGYWWETFGVVIVVFIILMIAFSIFSIPSFIYTIIKSATAITENDITQITSLFTDPVYIFLALISAIGQYILYAVYLIATVFIYFDINERKNASGAIDKIDNLGN